MQVAKRFRHAPQSLGEEVRVRIEEEVCPVWCDDHEGGLGAGVPHEDPQPFAKLATQAKYLEPGGRGCQGRPGIDVR